MRDILFDEKIARLVSFTPAKRTKKADNGNRSQVHWDMVSISAPIKAVARFLLDGNYPQKRRVSAKAIAIAESK